MKKTTSLFAVAALLAFATSTTQGQAVSLNFTLVGDPGNAADPATGFGAVGNSYLIGTTEVTNNQYVAFLSQIAATDPNAVWNGGMAITRSGSVGSYTYAANPSFGQKPVTNVSFFNAMRYVNWLENGQPEAAAGYDNNRERYLFDQRRDKRDARRAARFFLPSEDEWYKAAYYDPRLAIEGGPPGDDHYWAYPTQSDTGPTAVPPVGDLNSANFAGALADMTNPSGYPTDVGAYAGTTSAYGGFDFGGNVWEWNESLIDGTDRGIRGGSFDSALTFLGALSRSSFDPGGASGLEGYGFRIAQLAIPEPGTAVLGLIGGLLLMLFSGRRSRNRTVG